MALVTCLWLPPFLLHMTVTCGDPLSSPCPFLMQPDCPGKDASVQVAVEKLQEENRLLQQKVTHVSVRHSVGKKSLMNSGSMLRARPCPQATLVDTHGPQKPDLFA